MKHRSNTDYDVTYSLSSRQKGKQPPPRVGRQRRGVLADLVDFANFDLLAPIGTIGFDQLLPVTIRQGPLPLAKPALDKLTPLGLAGRDQVGHAAIERQPLEHLRLM